MSCLQKDLLNMFVKEDLARKGIDANFKPLLYNLERNVTNMLNLQDYSDIDDKDLQCNNNQ